MNKDNRYVFSSIRISLNVIITIVVAGALLLVNFFVVDGIGGAGRPHDFAYWIEKILGALGTFMIMISVANVTEDARKRKDNDFADRIKAIDTHYKFINENSLTEDMEYYILQKNITAKYLAHIKKWKKKLKKAKEDERSAIEQKLIMTPDEVWACPDRIRFVKITYSQLISGATEVSPLEEENDLSVHKGRLVAKKLMMKALSIVGAGLYLSEIASHFQEFSSADVLPLVMRIILILWACYSGVCFGYAMVDRILVVLKRKIKVFAEFDARTATNNKDKYKIALPKDAQLDKLKSKYNVRACVCERETATPQPTKVSTETPTPTQNATDEPKESEAPSVVITAEQTITA